jgi:hypothetical protein
MQKKFSYVKNESRTTMPNFFLPTQHLEASMKALEIATSGQRPFNSDIISFTI